MLQVEKSSYVWLPLLPRLDGRGYELVYAEKWSPSDYHERARIPVLYNNGSTAEGVNVGSSMPSAQGLGSQSSSVMEPAGAAAEVRATLTIHCSPALARMHSAAPVAWMQNAFRPAQVLSGERSACMSRRTTFEQLLAAQALVLA